MHLAENSLFITIARILWAFNILPGLDSEGKEIPVDIDLWTWFKFDLPKTIQGEICAEKWGEKKIDCGGVETSAEGGPRYFGW